MPGPPRFRPEQCGAKSGWGAPAPVASTPAGAAGCERFRRFHTLEPERVPLGSLAADIAGDPAASGGVADMDRVLQVESFDQRREQASALSGQPWLNPTGWPVPQSL